MQAPRRVPIGALLFVSILLCGDCATAFAQLIAVRLEPSPVLLFGKGTHQQLLVTGMLADGTQKDLTLNARLQSSNSGIVVIGPSGRIIARKPGVATVTAFSHGRSTTTRVLVTDYGNDQGVEFVRDVLPVLTMKGCNSGNCHGSLHGKNGFKLSLFGYDSDHDYGAITREARGRRVNLVEPNRSLILLKPSSVIAHGGGTRFAVDSPEFRLIGEWLARGAPRGTRNAASVIERLEVLPAERAIPAVGAMQQLVVRAHYRDRTVGDVTSQVQYAPQDESVATVDEGGRIKAHRQGETTILIRLNNTVAVSRVVVLGSSRIAEYPQLPRNNFMDDLVYAKLRSLHMLPSELASDEVFLRRVYLDLIGTLPTSAEARVFLADPNPEKRTRLIDSLLERPEYADYWGLIWADLLTVTAFKSGASNPLYLSQWVRDQLRRNVPLDQFATKLMAGNGSVRESPGIGLVVSRPPEQAAAYFGQLFMGVRLQCAQCHDHPFENWTRNDYYGMVAFFSQVRTRGSRAGTLVYDDPTKSVQNPVTGKAAVARFLRGDTLARPESTLRNEFARWLTSPGNPYFARAAVNRVWAQLMGRGLVEPVDDFRNTNPASNPALLDALSASFERSRYNLKHLIRDILNSRTYQLSSTPNETNASDRQNYSHYMTRRLYAETLLDAITAVTGATHKFKFGYAGMRAVDIHDPVMPDAFLQAFDRNRREITCERDENITLLQTLEMISGDTINEKIRAPGGVADQLIAGGRPDAEIVEELFLSAVSRYPDPEESRAAVQAIAESKSRKFGVQDVMWALLNSREFLFNH